MDPIEEIREKLSPHPHLSFSATSDSIEVSAPSEDGFAVSLQVDGSEFMVAFDGWHHHFDSAEDALNCFAWGLSGGCRLRVTYRGSTPVSSTVEHLEDGRWQSFETTALFFRPFWRRRRVVFLQNPPLRITEPVARTRTDG